MKQYETPVLHRMDVAAEDVLMASEGLIDGGSEGNITENPVDVPSPLSAKQGISVFQ